MLLKVPVPIVVGAGVVPKVPPVGPLNVEGLVEIGLLFSVPVLGEVELLIGAVLLVRPKLWPPLVRPPLRPPDTPFGSAATVGLELIANARPRSIPKAM